MLMREWDQQIDALQWTVKEGGGIKNIHILGILRSLAILYEQISAMQQAINCVNEQQDGDP